MRLLDSVTKEKIKLDKKDISIYLCGPTVYDDARGLKSGSNTFKTLISSS